MASVIADTSLERYDSRNFANQALKGAAGFWFVTAVVGQLAFVFYLVGLYGRAAVRGDLEVLNKVMPRGYVAGDTVGNLAIAAHIFLAVIIILGGAVQLTPQIRSRWPSFHRWTGRIYLPAVVVTSIIGLYMVWVRGAVGDLSQHLGITLDAILIIVFAALALRYALARKFAVHRRWALRLFIVSSGVWFFRVGFMFWIVINQGPVGFDPKTFTGPFLTFLAFADYLLPLTILEIYMSTKERGSTAARIGMAAALFVLTLAMGVGIAAATALMWLPRI